MAELVLSHHAQGRTPGVLALADDLRDAGHTVHVPDLYAGRTFATLEGGMAHLTSLGFGTVTERGVRAVDALFVFPGDAHLFVDDSLPSHDAAARGQVLERVLQLLAKV